MNQSLWANANALIITMVIVKALALVIKLPIGPFIKPPIIKNNPAPNSARATKDARKGEKPKYLIKASGGNGNLLNPCKQNAIPNPNLINQGDKNWMLEKNLLIWLSNLFIFYALCEPSQRGWLLVCLQAQKNIFFVSSAL